MDESSEDILLRTANDPRFTTLWLGAGEERIPLSFAPIPAGEFLMGQRGENFDEEPVHRVVMPVPFYLGVFPVTQNQYRVIATVHAEALQVIEGHSGSEPSHFKGDLLPVENVSAFEAEAVCNWLTLYSGLLSEGWVVRLPTEAEWEYACRANTRTAYWSGDAEDDLKAVGWYLENSGQRTHTVGELNRPNGFGLHDVHGNVSEWCLNEYDPRSYRRQTDGARSVAMNRLAELENEVDPTWQQFAALFQDLAGKDHNGDMTNEQTELLGAFLKGARENTRLDFPNWEDDSALVEHAKKGSRWPTEEKSRARSLGDFSRGVSGATARPGRVVRGGAFSYSAKYCRVACRSWIVPIDRFGFIGFRLGLFPGPPRPEQEAAAQAGSANASRDGAASALTARAAAAPVARGGGVAALSSADGQRWFGTDKPFPWPTEPDSSVQRLVLGHLDPSRQIVLDASTLQGLTEIRLYYPALTHLHLWGCRNLATVDGLPQTLEHLDIRHCELFRACGPLPPRIYHIDFAECPALEQWPAGDLTDLNTVYLEGCHRLPSFVPLRAVLPKLQTLHLHGCRFNDLPTELCGESKENVAVSVQDHFAARINGDEILAECKVVLLGNGGVGKTSLVRSLRGDLHDSAEDPTDGIRLWRWDGGGYKPFPEVADCPKVSLNIWDFGGQDLYHNTHRLFLETRAVFIVVWRRKRRDSRPFRANFPDDPVRPLNYWLDQVFSINPDAQVLIVRAWADTLLEHELDDGQDELRPEYQQVPRFEISSKQRDSWDLPKLRTALLTGITRELRSEEAARVGKGRIAVRRSIEGWQPAWDEPKSSPKALLRFHEFREMAQQIHISHGLPFTDREAVSLRNYLHNIGAIYAPPAWFRAFASPDAAPVVIDQRWLIDGIYQLLRVDSAGYSVLRHAEQNFVSQLLTLAWERLTDQAGQPLYDATAQWVMRQYMQHCGLLVQTDETFVLPEFLPDWSVLQVTGRDELLRVVSRTELALPRRSFPMRHRSLGQGFGCFLVGMLANRFKTVPLFRYGGLGEIEVGSRWGGGERRVVFRLAWQRLLDQFQGDIVLTIYGENSADDADVCAQFEAWLSELPGMPQGLCFSTSAGLEVYPLPVLDRRTLASPVTRVRARPRLGTIGLSVAGNDAGAADIELWPRVIRDGLLGLPDRDFNVLYYRDDKERATVTEITADLARVDLLVAVIGRKYLESSYCLTELLLAVTQWQSDNVFLDPTMFTPRIRVVFLPDALELLIHANDVTSPSIRTWVAEWQEKLQAYDAKAFHGDAHIIPAIAPIMKYLHDEKAAGLQRILKVLRELRPDARVWNAPAVVPQSPEASVQNIVSGLGQQMKGLLAQLTPEATRERYRQQALSAWRDLRPDDAADAFERWLSSLPDPNRAAAEAYTEAFVDPELEPIRIYWRKRQGKN